MADEEKYGHYRSRDNDGNLQTEFHGDEADQPRKQTKQGTGSTGETKKTGSSKTESEKE